MKPAKNLVQKVARQVAQEPIEILKEVQGQTIGTSAPPQEQGGEPQKEVTQEVEVKIKAQGQRQLQALEKEIKDIQVLKQQKEQIQAKETAMAQAKKEEEKKPLPQVSSKPSRRLFPFGRKAQAQKQQTRVEKILPPSG